MGCNFKWGTELLILKPKISFYNTDLAYDFNSNLANVINLVSPSTLSRKKIFGLPLVACFGRLSISALILLALSSTSAQALSAVTAKTIQGTAPYIELNGIKATDLSRLLSIKVGADTYISDSNGIMLKVGAGGALTPVPAITLEDVGAQFNSVGTLVTPDGNYQALDTVISLADRKDDDGDGPFIVAGGVTGEWKDKRGNEVTNLTEPVAHCNAPYTLTFTSTGSIPVSISTPYGDPRQTTYDNSSAVFTINPAGQPSICYAKPNMSRSTGGYAGPSNMWDTTRGFITQSTTPETYNTNFPTTGAHGLYFDLDIAGVPSVLQWDDVQVGNVTAKISNVSNTSVRVTLEGPVADPYVAGATASGWRGTGNGYFVLKGKDSAGAAVVEYGFKLNKWFVGAGLVDIGNQAASAAWCAGLAGASGYGLPHLRDLTNATGIDHSGIPYNSATPRNPNGNQFYRYVEGGLYAEWGDITNYEGPAPQFIPRYSWTDENEPNGAPIWVWTDGMISSSASSVKTICVQY